MNTIKTVGIRKLKDNLSGYLREIQSGAIILITDRDRVVAELREPSLAIIPVLEQSLQAEWIRDKKLIPPKTKKKRCLASHLNMKEGTSLYLLNRDRDE